MNVESATRTPSSSINGSLCFGAWRKSPRTFSYGRPDNLRSVSVLVTKGLGSGRPNMGPKVWSVIMRLFPVAVISESHGNANLQLFLGNRFFNIEFDFAV